jgi:superoxide dismutase, Fe-Mn family
MSSGYVWLVTDRYGSLGVLPTFAAGTMLVRAREQRYSVDRNISPPLYQVIGEERVEGLGGAQAPPEDEGDFDADSFGATSRRRAPRSPTPPDGSASPASGAARGLPSFSPSSPSRSLSTSAAHQSSSFSVGASVYNGDSFDMLNMSQETKSRHSIGEDNFPLFCVSVNEHAWMAGGYGVWGQEEYLKRFWTVLDWEKVSASWSKFVVPRSLATY